IGTLNHNLQVDLIWQANLTGRPHGFTSRRDLLHPRIEDLVRVQSEANQWFVDWARQQNAATLAETVPFQFVSGRASEMQRGAMFLHVINHKTFHRGWVSQMFFDFESRPPQTDISVYLTE
ncbi:MAG TPA: DinB family protein, partial [Gammaproteobacteria bacterium]|nr:DinB family protein [Gammaproteobacteria bacterium]